MRGVGEMSGLAMKTRHIDTAPFQWEIFQGLGFPVGLGDWDSHLPGCFVKSAYSLADSLGLHSRGRGRG